VRAFLSHLAISEAVAASTQNQALAALTFLYAKVLLRPFARIEGIAPARRSTLVPVVLSAREIEARAFGDHEPRSATCHSLDVCEDYSEQVRHGRHCSVWQV